MFKHNENIDGAGFVKFRALVYEGKETDFDDHDITLWFVGAKALKLMPGADRYRRRWNRGNVQWRTPSKRIIVLDTE